MARTILNPWVYANDKLLALGYTQDQIDDMTLDELSEIWENL